MPGCYKRQQSRLWGGVLSAAAAAAKARYVKIRQVRTGEVTLNPVCYNYHECVVRKGRALANRERCIGRSAVYRPAEARCQCARRAVV